MDMNAERLIFGLALLILGIALISISNFPNTSYGALVLIGPFPILVASDYGIAVFLILLAFALLLILQIFRWLR